MFEKKPKKKQNLAFGLDESVFEQGQYIWCFQTCRVIVINSTTSSNGVWSLGADPVNSCGVVRETVTDKGCDGLKDVVLDVTVV